MIKPVTQCRFVPKTMNVLTPTEALQTRSIPERSNNPAPTRNNPFRTININECIFSFMPEKQCIDFTMDFRGNRGW